MDEIKLIIQQNAECEERIKLLEDALDIMAENKKCLGCSITETCRKAESCVEAHIMAAANEKKVKSYER